MTLVEFLEARIADDEDAARQSAGTEPLYQYPPGQGAHYELVVLGVSEGGSEEAAVMAHRFDPARVLAECAAKRRIIEWHVKTGEKRSRWHGECCEENYGEIEWLEPDEQEISVGTTGSGHLSVRESFATQADIGCTTLRMMAAVWSSHPEFDPVWATA